MFRRTPQISATLLVLLTAFPARQAFAAPAPAPPSLADALAAVKPPAGGLVLSVGAAQCPLPPGEALPSRDASLQAVAGAFRRTVRTFGAVTSVAPLTMTLLNTRPVNANIYDGMPPQDAMKFLAASLTQGQWQQLKSDQGLGLSDMVSDTQSSLFKAILPQKLQVAPQAPAGAGAGSAEPPLGTRDLTALLPQVRLRLRRRVNLMVPQIGDSSFLFAEQHSDTGRETRYRLVSDNYFSPKASLYGVPVKAEVANVPKQGDLDLDNPALRVAVPLTGIKTVGALLARVGSLSGLELYADRRWEGRALTVLGTPPPAPTADVLRSLAFCLTGTYRRVGPAFVLTDDVLGVGSRRAVLSEFEATASALRQKALYAAGDALAGAEALTDLPPTADSMTYSAAQKKEAERFYAQSGFSSANQTLDQLTPVQKAAVEATPAYTDPDGTAHTPDLSGQFIVQEVPYLELLVPALDGPVDASLSRTLYALFQPTPPAPDAPTPPSSASSGGALPVPMATLIKPIPSRAVLASLHTAAEVQDLVAVIKKLGLNQLWLPVVPTSDLALLSQAVRSTKGRGIAVYAVVDLLTRPQSTSADAVDLTLLGRTSAQAQAARAEREALAGPSPFKPAVSLPAVDGVAVSPFSAAVGRDLLALTHTLVTMPDVAGIVWRATAMPGYDEGLRTTPDGDFLSLGYTPPARLAFLRREHVDPLDLFPAETLGHADTSLPGFDNAALENNLEMKWNQFRFDADRSLLAALFRQVAMGGATSASKPLLLVQQRGPRPPTVTWYGSWAGPDAPLPTFHSPIGVAVAEKVQARAQSKITVVDLPIQSSLAEAAILRRWSGPLQSIGKNHSWDGFVLECQPTKVP